MPEPSDGELEEQLKQALEAKQAAKGVEQAGKNAVVKKVLERKTGKAGKAGKNGK